MLQAPSIPGQPILNWYLYDLTHMLARWLLRPGSGTTGSPRPVPQGRTSCAPHRRIISKVVVTTTPIALQASGILTRLCPIGADVRVRQATSMLAANSLNVACFLTCKSS